MVGAELNFDTLPTAKAMSGLVAVVAYNKLLTMLDLIDLIAFASSLTSTTLESIGVATGLASDSPQ